MQQKLGTQLNAVCQRMCMRYDALLQICVEIMNGPCCWMTDTRPAGIRMTTSQGDDYYNNNSVVWENDSFCLLTISEIALLH